MIVSKFEIVANIALSVRISALRVVDGQRDACTPNPCRNGGQCSLLGAGSYSCSCSAGFYGVNCSLFNPCSPADACFNGGTCHYTSPVTYTCRCPAGFYGSRCEVSHVISFSHAVTVDRGKVSE